jgi:hypothetical protein
MKRFVIAAIVGVMSLPAAGVYAQSRTSANTGTPDQAGRMSPASAAWELGAANANVSSMPLSRPLESMSSSTATGGTASSGGRGSVPSPDAAGRMSSSTAAGQEGATNPDTSNMGTR